MAKCVIRRKTDGLYFYSPRTSHSYGSPRQNVKWGDLQKARVFTTRSAAAQVYLGYHPLEGEVEVLNVELVVSYD